jgi:hypothetical protein
MHDAASSQADPDVKVAAVYWRRRGTVIRRQILG